MHRQTGNREESVTRVPLTVTLHNVPSMQHWLRQKAGMRQTRLELPSKTSSDGTESMIEGEERDWYANDTTKQEKRQLLTWNSAGCRHGSGMEWVRAEHGR